MQAALRNERARPAEPRHPSPLGLLRTTQQRLASQLRISANVTGDFGNVTGLRSGAGLRVEDCRDGLVLAGFAIS